MKLFLPIILLCLIIQSSYSQQNTNGWYWANSQPQSNVLNWVKIIDASHYYAVGDNGTFMKSLDGGDTWTINSSAGVPENLFGSGRTNDLNTAWFFNANTGIVAGQSVSGDGGIIRRTTNAGETFTSINLGIPSGLSVVYDMHFINSNTGYLCGNNTTKAFKTTNAGLNWTLLPNLPISSAFYSSIYAIDENNILIGLNSEGLYRHIYRTSNGGATWIDQTLPGSVIVDIKDILFQNSNTGYICGNSVASNPSYFATTTDGGVTWIESVFPNKQHGLYDLHIKGANVYALGASFTSYFYSSDLGNTWDSVYFNDLSNLNQPGLFFVYSFDINVDNEIVVGALGKVNVSNDGGSTWRNKNYSVINSANVFGTFPTVFALRGTEKVWAGGDAGLIIYSSNNGTNWTKQQTSAPYGFRDIEMLNSMTGYAVGGLLTAGVGYCFKTTNGGNSWLPLPIFSPTTPVYNLDFVDVNTGWIFGGYPFGSQAIVSKTTNGGVTWVNQATTPVLNSVMSDGNMVDANTGYCVSGGNVWKTINGGSNWNILNSVTPGLSWNRVLNLSNNTVFIAGEQRIYKSFNGGISWDSATINTISNIFNMDWVDKDNGMVVGTAGFSAKTTDGGNSWTERNPGSSTLTGVSMKSKDTVYATCDRNVYGVIVRLYDTPTSMDLNLTVGIQGFWNGTTQVSDTVVCHLRKAVAPFNEMDIATSVLNSSGNGIFTFNQATSGKYYLEVTHRNSLETWSGGFVGLSSGGTAEYDFTTASSQAYGDNMILTSGRYCDYSGDVTQEGSVDLNDVVIVNNASSVFTTGYVVQDVTGDNIVDLSDLVITFNNASNFVAKITP